MTRIYTQAALVRWPPRAGLGPSHPIHSLLDKLADKETSSAAYRATMFELGQQLGETIVSEIADPSARACLACTAEDADFLAKGMLSALEPELAEVVLTCLWNQRVSPFGIAELAVAPIIREYQEPPQGRVQYLIVAKSIISSGCVVRTNVLHLIDRVQPDTIFIAAPVLHSESQARLKEQFAAEVAAKFRFVYFAEDTEKTAAGEVVPGVGGFVEERLGLGDGYVPAIVKERRARFVGV